MQAAISTTRRDWYRLTGVSVFTMTAVLWMGHYLVHLMFTPF